MKIYLKKIFNKYLIALKKRLITLANSIDKGNDDTPIEIYQNLIKKLKYYD